MKKVLVLGASGGMGYALVRELVSRGIAVVAFARRKEKLDALYKDESDVIIFAGDVLDKVAVTKAAKGVDTIFHAVNFPYPVWAKTHPLCIEVLIQVAEAQQAKIAFVDNIYAYGPSTNVKVSENMRKRPQTKKGKIRFMMEERLLKSKVPTLIVHLPDLYGPNAESTLLHETFKSVVQNKKANFIGKINIAREYLYTFDGAKAMVELAQRDNAYNQNWNIPAIHPITGTEIVEILRTEIGYNQPIRTINKTMIRMIGLFQPLMREMVEMMYLTETPIILDGEKYKKEIGEIPKTPYEKGIHETLKWIKNNK